MTIDREELAAIKKRNEVTYRFKQNLTEAEADRSALLDALEEQEAMTSALNGDVTELGQKLEVAEAEIADLVSRGSSQYAAVEAAKWKHDSDQNLISSLQWQIENDRKIGAEWKQRAEAAEAREKKLLAAVKNIAKQRLHAEITDCDPDEIDWLSGYEGCVKNARAVLAETAP